MEKCPYCGTEVNVEVQWHWNDMVPYFTATCQECKSDFEVEVQPVPIFICRKK